MRKWLRKMLISLLVILVASFVAVGLYLQQPKFGKAPAGIRRERMQSSRHYADGQFQNLTPTPQIDRKSVV